MLRSWQGLGLLLAMPQIPALPNTLVVPTKIVRWDQLEVLPSAPPLAFKVPTPSHTRHPEPPLDLPDMKVFLEVSPPVRGKLKVYLIPQNSDYGTRWRYSVLQGLSQHPAVELVESGGAWHCIVGKHFGSFVTHETKSLCYFFIGHVGFLIFKHG